MIQDTAYLVLLIRSLLLLQKKKRNLEQAEIEYLVRIAQVSGIKDDIDPDHPSPDDLFEIADFIEAFKNRYPQIVFPTRKEEKEAGSELKIVKFDRIP